MELWSEILCTILEHQTAEVTFPNLKLNPKEIVEMECYKALYRIKEILEDETLNDADCFRKIEEIVRLFEAMGSSCGYRHDFG